MPDTESNKIPELVREKITFLDEKSEVILFGSRARGDWKENSDWDFLILMSQDVSEQLKREIRDRLFEIELDTDEIISSIIENKIDWQNYKVTPLYKNIRREGISI